MLFCQMQTVQRINQEPCQELITYAENEKKKAMRQ